MKAAGLNPVDFKTREGKLRVIQRYALPVVLGCELSGVVASVGEGVTRLRPGDEVFARVAKERLGAFAEKACVHEDLVATKPASLDFTHAAAVPLAALTALQALRDELAVKEGMRVFIPGCAGGVGTFALQLAKYFGATVATTASPRGRALVERLGADVVVDYTAQDFTKELRDYDAALDLVGGDTLMGAFSVVRRGGKVVSIAGLPEPTTATKDLERGAPASASARGARASPTAICSCDRAARISKCSLLSSTRRSSRSSSTKFFRSPRSPRRSPTSRKAARRARSSSRWRDRRSQTRQYRPTSSSAAALVGGPALPFAISAA